MDLRLPAAAGELTRAEQKILDYINTNTDTFLFSSIGQLAERLELSDATVSRFARHVGCRDFKALKSLVQMCIRDRRWAMCIRTLKTRSSGPPCWTTPPMPA